MARMKRGGGTGRPSAEAMEKAKMHPHEYEGNGPVCEKCGTGASNSIHKDMNEIAERNAEKQGWDKIRPGSAAKSTRPPQQSPAHADTPVAAGEGARATNIRLKNPPA